MSSGGPGGEKNKVKKKKGSKKTRNTSGEKGRVQGRVTGEGV